MSHYSFSKNNISNIKQVCLHLDFGHLGTFQKSVEIRSDQKTKNKVKAANKNNLFSVVKACYYNNKIVNSYKENTIILETLKITGKHLALKSDRQKVII